MPTQNSKSTTNTFFTTVGCIDGRVQEVVAQYGKSYFNAQYPDTITEAGMDGAVSHAQNSTFLESLENKLLISIERHNSRGVIVHGHEDCAGNPVSEEQHKEDIKKDVSLIQELTQATNIEVIGVYVRVTPEVNVERVI